MSTTKPKQVRIYVHGPYGPYLESLAERFNLPETTVLSMVVGAGLKAIRDNQSRWEMPLYFRVADAPDAVPPARARALPITKK